MLPAPCPCLAYPPVRLFGRAGGGQAGRLGRLRSPRPRHALPAQGPPGAGPLPVVIPGGAQARARAREPSGPAPAGPALAPVPALVRGDLVPHTATSSRDAARHSHAYAETGAHTSLLHTWSTRCSAGWKGASHPRAPLHPQNRPDLTPPTRPFARPSPFFPICDCLPSSSFSAQATALGWPVLVLWVRKRGRH